MAPAINDFIRWNRYRVSPRRWRRCSWIRPIEYASLVRTCASPEVAAVRHKSDGPPSSPSSFPRLVLHLAAVLLFVFDGANDTAIATVQGQHAMTMKRPFPVAGRMRHVNSSFLPAQFLPLPVLSLPSHRRISRDVAFLTWPPRQRHVSPSWTMTAKVTYVKIALHQVCVP